jgi:pimeloyl-ACP methyl ester carboxylesterase
VGQACGNAIKSAVLVVLLPLVACTTVDTTGVVGAPGATIAYSTAGQSAPSIFFQSGLGDGKAVWGPVLRELGGRHRVFSYDRPGYGDSPASSVARDPCSIAREAHAVLAAAHVALPYLLVGHSLGGLYQYAFARLYPEEVAGMVLLDPTHPDHWATLQQDAPVATATLKAMRSTVFSATERREFDEQADCLNTLAIGPPVRAPTRILVSTRRSALDMGDFERVLQRLQADWLRLTSAQKLEPVAGAEHYIQRDRPAAVAAAIEAIVRDEP